MKKKENKLSTPPKKLISYKLQASCGFLLVEAILSVALFALLVTALSGAYLYGEESTMLAGNRQRAIILAEEGLEATRNIRDAGFSNLTNGTYGLTTTGNQWNFSGSSDTNDIYTRSVTISSVDAVRKNVTSNVTWQQNSQRAGAISIVSRITNWLALIMAPGGLLIYGDGTNIPKFRTYETATNAFSAQTSALTNAIGQTYIIRTSPTSATAVAGFVTSAGVLNVMCFNGLSWSQEWSVTVGGNGSTRRFDIAYETNSGQVVVLYSRNVATTNELAYRTKLGGSGCGPLNWSVASNLNPVRTSGTVQWVKMAWDKRSSSNLITAIWADSNSDLSTMVWNGSVWANEPPNVTETSLEVVVTAVDVEDFDVEYESVSGNVMVVWANSAGNNGTNGVRYRRCIGGASSCTWGAVTTPPTFADDATNLDLSANPNTNEMVFASIGNAGNDLQIGYWSGSAWSNTANADITSSNPIAGSKLVSTGWLISGATTRSFIRYADSAFNFMDWYIGNVGVFTKQTDWVQSPAPNISRYNDVQMDPVNKDQILSLVSDSANDLFAKRLVMTAGPTFTWTNSDGVALATTLPQAINSPFSFAFWRQ